jgi:hypothetical protein
MIVTVEGTESKAEILAEAARFFAKELLGSRMAKNLIIDIEVLKKFDVEGCCGNEDETKRSRWFTISLKDRKIGDMIQTLAHEMVHVKQYVRNELGNKSVLVCRGDKIVLRSQWMGEVWEPKGNEDAYFDAPWEIEAYGRERGLAVRFMKYNKEF